MGFPLNASENHIFLQIKHVIDDPTEKNVDESKAYEHEKASEDLSDGRCGGDVPVAYGAHGDDTEVEGVDERMCFGAGEMVAVERIDKDPKGEVEDE